MKPILDALTVLKAYGKAMETAFERTVEVLPTMAIQYTTLKANEKLETSKDEYLNALSAEIKGDVMIVEIDANNWVANAVEAGSDPFDMKRKHLQSPKARFSKSGFKYLIIPMGKDPNQRGPSTTKGQLYQKKLKEVLHKPSLGQSFLKHLPNGKIAEMQQVLTADPMMKGLYKTRTFDNAAEMKNTKKKWGYVLFRIMSDNPKSVGKWEHPGIRPQHILKDTEKWIHNNIGDIYESILQEELDNFLKR